MLIPALLCDGCRTTVHVRPDPDVDFELDLIPDAEQHGWHVQHTVKDHTYGRAVCPLCRRTDDRKDWA